MGRQLGSKYVLQDSIGRGAMGEVFRGHDDVGHELAFKVLHPDMAGDPQIVARFVQERSILLSVSGPNLVQVVDLVVEGHTLAIAMELVSGQDLRAHLKRFGTIAPAMICQIGAGIASGLALIHDAGIVHRDIKPENVLIARDNGGLVPKVTDFGVSSLVDTERARSTMLVGTPQYIAPEASEGGAITAASDLYALGIVLYEMACGVTPFAGGSVMAVLRRHSAASPGRPAAVPDELWDLISWLLAKNPAQRPPNARQVATVLEALAPTLKSYPPAPRLTTPPAPAPSLETQATQAVSFPVGLPNGGNLPDGSSLPDAATSMQQSSLQQSGNSHGTPGTAQGVSLPPTTSPTMAAPHEPAQHGAGHPAATADTASRRPKKSRKGLWIALISVLAVILLAGGSLTVLNLLGKKGDDAGADAGVLPTQSTSSAASEDPTPEPSPSDEATPSDKPMPTDGSWPTGEYDTLYMPDYVGQTLAEAKQSLDEVPGDPVTVTVKDKYDISSADGTVLSQFPESGQYLGVDVELTVARSEVTAYLEDQSPVSGDAGSFEAAKISGETYAHSMEAPVCGYSSSDSVEYNLGRKYASFSATAGIADDSADSSAVVLLEVFADGRKVSTQSVTYGKPFTVTADMTDALRMKIQWQATSCDKDLSSGTYLALGEAKLVARPGKAPVESALP